jgi:hypothetical protein
MKNRIINKKQFYNNCPKCNKEIFGSSEAMVIGNLKIHIDSKKCKRLQKLKEKK